MKNLDKVDKYWLTQLGDSLGFIPGEEMFFNDLLEIAKRSQKILEVGVGRGRMVKILKREGVDADFLGVDLTVNLYHSGIKNAIADTRRLPFRDNSFDLTYSLGVVEHFPETEIAVNEHARVTKPGGYILIAVPHLAILTPIRYLTYFFKDRMHGTFEETKGRNIRAGVMKKYFAAAGITIKKNGFYGIWVLDYYLRKYSIGRSIMKLQKMAIIGSYQYLIGQVNNKKLDINILILTLATTISIMSELCCLL